MNAKIAVYNNHEDATKALVVLSNHKFPMKLVSLIGKAEIVDDHVHIKSLEKMKKTPVLLGVGSGTVLGLLTGLGVFTIPGFGVLYGAGAIVGTLAGFDIGLVSGGIVTLLATLGIKKDQSVKFEEHIQEGKFFIVVNGSLEEIKKAEHILHTEGTHLEIF